MARGKLVLTYQDYLQMPDDRTRREILRGDLYVTPAPSPAHQRLVLRLAVLLDAWVRRHALGEVFPSPLDVVLSEVDVVQPAWSMSVPGDSTSSLPRPSRVLPTLSLRFSPPPPCRSTGASR